MDAQVVREHAALALLVVRDDDARIDLLLGNACRRYPDYLLVEHLVDPPADPPADPGVEPPGDVTGVAPDDVATDAGPVLSAARFFAFGFRRIVRSEPAIGPGERCTWYEFRLSHYKSAPDWLNARFWANPERFALQPGPTPADD